MNNTATKEIRTQRLTLRKTRLLDFFHMTTWFCDERVSVYSQGDLKNKKKTALIFLVQRAYNYYVKHENNYYYWAIDIDGKMEGFVILQKTSGEEVYSFYYMLSPELWGKGYATEAVSAVIEYMKTQNARVLKASADSNNTASLKVIKKCGFEYKRTIKDAFKYRDGRSGDAEVYFYKLK